MSSTILRIPDWLGLATLALAPSVLAQNLLTNNPGFEANSAYFTPGWGWPQGAPDALPGWVITLDSSGDGYAGAANDQSPQGLVGTRFGYIYSGTGSSGRLETAPGSRAPVDAGTTYTLWFLARGDAPWGESLATVSLVWYSNQSNTNPIGVAASLELTLPARLDSTDLMQTLHISAEPPPGSHFAGVRISRPAYDYAPILLDDFVVMAEPTLVPLTIERNGPHALLRWPRELVHQLQQCAGFNMTNDWNKVNQPIKGIGAFNQVDYPQTEAVMFFRLAAAN